MQRVGPCGFFTINSTWCYTFKCQSSLLPAPTRRPGSPRRPRSLASSIPSCARRFERSCRDKPTTWAGGVFKKRLNDNLHRSLVLAKGGHYWVFAYLFAKKDRDNITTDEFLEFRKLAAAYARMTTFEVNIALHNGDLLEICHDE